MSLNSFTRDVHPYQWAQESHSRSAQVLQNLSELVWLCACLQLCHNHACAWPWNTLIQTLIRGLLLSLTSAQSQLYSPAYRLAGTIWPRLPSPGLFLTSGNIPGSASAWHHHYGSDCAPSPQVHLQAWTVGWPQLQVLGLPCSVPCALPNRALAGSATLVSLLGSLSCGEQPAHAACWHWLGIHPLTSGMAWSQDN